MGEKIDKNKLTIPIYLNTKIVFDMLSALKELMALANLFSDKPKNNNQSKRIN